MSPAGVQRFMWIYHLVLQVSSHIHISLLHSKYHTHLLTMVYLYYNLYIYMYDVYTSTTAI